MGVALSLFAYLIIGPADMLAQGIGEAFQESEFDKVEQDERQEFQSRFDDIKWTGKGLYGSAVIDDIPTMEIRARLQKVFGNPTQKLDDLIGRRDFRPAEYVQFEYWFTVNDSIPMMVLDLDGPFEKGLVYGGASRYIDLMPQIKRTFSKKLMEVDSLAPYEDYYYHLKREQWYLVEYQNGEFVKEEVEQPDHMKLHPQSKYKNY